MGAGREGAVRGADAARLTRRLTAVLLVVVGAAVARTTNESRPSYTVYVGPWTSCHPLSGDPPPPPPPPPQPSQRYYQDRAADKMGATSRHVGHLRDFRHLDAGRALLPARSLVHTPRLGYQRREVGCRDAAGLATEIMNCNALLDEVPTMQMCIVSTDCALGDWSAWRARPGGGYTRTRSVLELPQGGGAECGLVEEVRPLLPEAGAHWAAGAWGACHVAGVTPDKSSVDLPPDVGGVGVETAASNASWAGPCGGGAQRREVTCVRADGRALHPAHCADLPSPPLQQPCEVACPRDCAVGEWGEWSACRPLGGCPMYPVQELTTAGYSVRRRRVVTAASAEGAVCPALQEARACAAPRCAAWRAQPWGACALSVAARNTVAAAGERALCGAGRRTRELRCLDHDQKEAPRGWCSRAGGAGGAGEWARSERCRIACSGDCVLSAWGAWGECSAACAAPGGDTPTRTRRRHVLAHASPDGWACPPERELVQREACNVHSCSVHAWLALPWSPCRPLAPRAPAPASPGDALPDLLGIKTTKDLGECLVAGENRREVRCVEDNERMVDDSLCAPLVKPAVRRACSLPCARACYRGPWSEWSPCPNTCEPAIQSRERAVEGGAECGARQERRACATPRSCQAVAPPAAAPAAAPPAWAAGAWGRCRLPPSVSCGWGLRTRGVWCSAGSHRVDASVCAGHARVAFRAPPTAAQRCRVPCAAYHDASAASAAAAHDALRRERCNEICLYGFEHEDSFEPTKADCNCPTFHVEILNTPSDCILPEGSSCGVGRKLHAALCIMEGVNNTILDMDICKKHVNLTEVRSVARESSPPHAQPPPPGYQHDDEFPGLLQSACAVPCPRDCAAGPWSEWGPCEQEQDSLAAFRLRTRVVLYGAESGGRECGATLQRAACTRRESAWRAGDWEACAPTEPPCGRALQNRTVRCVIAETGEEVSEEECPGEGPARQAACDAPCPADCVVSQWSDWSPCEQYKSGGRRDRTRVVLRAPAPYGAPCPHLVEAEPCTPRSHAWYVAPWDDCQPLGGSPCGEGTKRRIVRCLRDDGVFVDDSFCPNMTASEARVSWCYVPCGADCELSEWGAWDASACTCGVGAHFHAQFMTRHRRRVSGAAWPGRACGAREQRAPCPRSPCVRFTQRAQSVNCLIEPLSAGMRSLRDARACGHGVTLTETACEPYEPGDDDAAAAGAAQLDVSRCGGVLPGRLFSTPLRYQTRKCKVQCACTHEAAMGGGGELGEWSAWGPCRGGARSRARQRLVRTRQHCVEPKFVTIEWANCSEAEVRAGLAPGPAGAAGVEDDGWLGDSPPARDAHVTKQRLDGSMWMNISLWVAASVVLLFGTWAPYHMLTCYRHCRNGKKIDHV